MMKTTLRLLVPVFFLIVLGCGTGGPPPATLLPVSGKVTVKGVPLAKGNIQFVPDKSKGNEKLFQPAGAIKDGVFTLETIERSDKPGRPGAPEGAYIVVVTAMDISSSVQEPKWLVNKKYSTAQSGLKAEVKADSKEFVFDLEP